MEGPFLEPIHAFGFGGPRGPGKPCQLACVSESTTVYAVGKVLAFHSEDRSPPLRFTTANSNVEAITAVVVSPNGKLVAACEKVRGAGQVTIYESRSRLKVKTLVTAFIGDFTACTFSPDGESLLTVANDEACTLTCWNLQKSKVLCTASVGSDVTRISFNKRDATEVATTGPRIFKLWRWNDKGLKAVSVAGISPAPRPLAGSGHRPSSGSSTPKSSAHVKSPTGQKAMPDFTDHAWLTDGTLAIANRDGVVFLVAEGQVQQKLNHNGPVYCLAATSKGFLAGSVLGRVLQYQVPATEAASQDWAKHEVTAGSGQSPVVCIALDPAEGSAKVVLDGESVLSLSLTAMEADLDSSKTYFTPILRGFHSGEVLGMDVCARRSLLASISADQSIRLWDYKKWASDLVHTLEEEPRAVAFNPWGYQLIVALPQRVFVFDILVNRLQVAAELNLKDCTKLKYSPSGHLAAAATPRELTVFSTLTWTPLAAFRGHSKPVSSLCWSADSLFLVSSDAHGNIYSWSMERLARAEESVVKGSDYTCVLYNEDRTALLACGASTPLRIFDTGKQLDAVESRQVAADPKVSHRPQDSFRRDSSHSSQQKDGSLSSSRSDAVKANGLLTNRTSDRPKSGLLLSTPIIRTNIVSEHFGGHSATVWMAGLFSRALLATGARNGALSLRPYPIISDSPGASPELFLHGGPLTSLCCVEASGLVFSSSIDGAIFASSVSGQAKKAQDEASEAPSTGLLASEEAPSLSLVLVEKTMLQDEEKEKEELRWSLQKLSDEAAYKLHRVEQDLALKLRAVEEEHARVVMGLRQTIKEHEKKHIEAEERYHTTLAVEREHKEEAVREATEKGEAKLLREARRADGLESELKTLTGELESRVEAKLAEHEARTAGILQEHRTYENKLRAEIEKLHKEAASKLRKAETQLVEEFEINEEELHNVMSRARTDYEQQVQRTFEARGQAVFERNKAAEAEGRKIALEQEVRERQEQVKKLELENAVLRDKIAKLEAHRRDTDQLLLEKEDEILHMRKTIGEHEAYAMIRDTKIKKLESKEEPLKGENSAQKQKLAEAEEREAAFASEFWTWQEAQRFLKAKVAGQEREMELLRAALHKKGRYIDMFTADLCKVVRDQDASEWPRMVKALYAAYVDDNRSAAVAEAREADDEVLRQKQCLERFVKVLKDTIARIEEKTGQDIERIRGENVLLLAEMAEGNRKLVKLKALLRQQQARVAHSWAVTRTLQQHLKRLDPTFSQTSPTGCSRAGLDGAGNENGTDDFELLSAELRLDTEGGRSQRAARVSSGRDSEPQKASDDEALSELGPPSPLPRLPQFNIFLGRGAPSASATFPTTFPTAERDGQRRPGFAPKRLSSSPGLRDALVVRPGTAAADRVHSPGAQDRRPQTSAAITRPLEASFSEPNFVPSKASGRPDRLVQSPSFGRLAKGGALAGPGSTASLNPGANSTAEGETEQRGQRASFRRAKSIKKSVQAVENSVAHLQIQSETLSSASATRRASGGKA